MAPKRTILITGGAGFIGSHVVRLFVTKYPDYRIVNLDKLTYAGNLANLRDIEDSPNYVFEKGDICDLDMLRALFGQYDEKYPSAATMDLLLMGQSGLGKTYLMHAIAKRLLERGFNVMMISAYRFLDVARRAYFSGKQEEMDTLMDTDVLMIDDMGVEPLMENITIVQWFNLINERQLRGKGTVISTNLNVEELRRRYTERITSRLLDGKQCMLLQFLGDDVRRNKA